MKRQNDIGQVIFPIETLIEARLSSSCCLHTEAKLGADPNPITLIQQPSHAAVMGKDSKLARGSLGF